MDMYDIIADEYDEFFPAGGTKLDFVVSRIGDDDARVLDFRCATGEMSSKISRSKRGARVTGIDANAGAAVKAERLELPQGQQEPAVVHIRLEADRARA